MHPLLSQTRGCLRTGSRCHAHFATRRAFKTSNALYEELINDTPSASSSTITKKVATRTKKKFSELPKQLVNADGSFVSPLPEWTGGLEVSSITKHPDELQLRESMTQSITKVRRSRKKKIDDASLREQADDTANGVALDTHTDVIPKPRRKRKPKIDTATKVVEEPVSVVNEPDTPLARDILGNLARFPHCILLTRVGGFYESYFDQAAEVSRLLNIKLTTKSWGGQRVLMCGFPLMHLNKYLKVLVQNNKRFVAICEEFVRDRSLGPKGGFDRRVTRIVTPGTLIDEPFLNPYENNYLMAITSEGETRTALKGEEPTSPPIGLAWIDVSTGDFFTQRTTLQALRDELVRIGPKEVVLDEDLKDKPGHEFRQALDEEGFFVSYIAPRRDSELGSEPVDTTSDDVVSHLEPAIALKTALLSSAETTAVKLLTAFMHANLLEYMPRLASPSRESSTGRMQIDAHTIKALEIRESMREGGTTGSLLSVVKKTITTSGTRLLARWLCSPSTSVVEINTRQSLVALFKSRTHLRADLVQYLNDIEDAARIVQKFLLGRGDASDLLAICNTINIWTSIQNRIRLEREMEQRRGAPLENDWASLDALLTRVSDLGDLARTIDRALARRDQDTRSPVTDEGAADSSGIDGFDSTLTDTLDGPSSPSGIQGNWTIKPEFSEYLTNLHATLSDLVNRREKLERRLQAEYDAPSLTLRSSPAQGMHVHIGRAKRDQTKIKADPQFIQISESASTSIFFNQEWSQLGAQILDTTTAIYVAEREAFETLRSEVNVHTSHLRKNARIVDELDVTLAFANLAEEMNFVRPVVREDTSYHVVNGRHPTVELGLLTSGRVFTPNTVSLSTDAPIHIITGPNMAGKSTLLRQTALITILAQTGSFVPADSAEIGIVDRVFSRVGAKDDLFRDRSTFMVEMLETADILRRATPKSLVIMDEVGRGTTVDDGLAIAFSAIHHLLNMNGCRVLFATHFHELADMLGHSEEDKGSGLFRAVRFYCTDVDETEDGYFAYSHRLRPGVNRDSHGLKVAQLAGMPPSAIGIATNAMNWLKARRSEGHGVRSKAELRSLGQMLAETQHSDTRQYITVPSML
ncbi:unnamed protein product [Somion occarium]|uniref:DNA mismatch repair proteins mutS family domain-containing protein n=1 Tax=Somion occarium TaxID=3059160 RepID=A0ABP1CKF6_9APHY